jgi:2-hydroxychromene-2-carboxylate isomerase
VSAAGRQKIRLVNAGRWRQDSGVTALEFFFDYSCPYAYLGSTRVDELAARTGAELEYKPFLLGGVFKAISEGDGELAAQAPARARMNGLDMQRWAEHWNVPLRMPNGHPNRTVLALRATLASGDIRRASRALFAEYWAEARDLSEPDVVAGALDRAGFDGAELVRRAEAPEIKSELRRRTDEAVERGVFGAPSFFVQGELYWGQDRMDFVERALGGEPPAPPPVVGTPASEFEYWYDFSSPFAYLASTQVEALARRSGARIVYKPFLLGALFNQIGTANVPMLGFSQSKQMYYARDLARFSEHYGVKFQFMSRFPLKSVLPLRVALASGEKIGPLSLALFHAAWAEDRDLEDPETLRDVCRAVGADPAAVDAASDPAVKQALRDNTDQAVARGLCGAPSFVVGSVVYWGQDRLGFVERALAGWTPRSG